MKIRDIEIIGLEYCVPEDKVYGASRAMMSKRQTPLFLLHTEDGITGVGEALTSPLLARANLEFLKPHFIGTDIHDRDATWSRLLNRFYHLGLQNPLIATYSGVNVAMPDALGKGLGLPVHKLIGGKARNKLTAYASNGYVTRNPQADLEAQLEKLKDQGYKCTKIKIGLNPASDEARCAAVRRIMGDDMVLMVDVNGNYTAELMLESMRRIDFYGIHWYEKPLPLWTDQVRGLPNVPARSALRSLPIYKPMFDALGRHHEPVRGVHRSRARDGRWLRLHRRGADQRTRDRLDGRESQGAAAHREAAQAAKIVDAPCTISSS